jgi:hypothetical protein
MQACALARPGAGDGQMGPELVSARVLGGALSFLALLDLALECWALSR